MLTITSRASEAMRQVLDSEEAPDGSVFRISPQEDVGLVVSITDSPPPDDHRVEGEDVAVSVEPSAAEMLDDKELDATIVEGRVNFSIGEQ
ncbi:MAG TPA: HesB/YadR/YfhF-family protein [Solirubrobacterales bacterium]